MLSLLIKVQEEILISFSQQLEIVFDEYFKTVKDYFVKNGTSLFLDVTESRLNLYMTKGKIKVKYLSVDLMKIDYFHSLYEFIDDLISTNMQLKVSLEEVENLKDEAMKRSFLYEEKLTEFVKTKEKWEKELFSKFVLVLNEKKKRIQYLTEVLEAKKYNLPVCKKNLSDFKQNEEENICLRQEQKIESISDSESDESYETDEEIQKEKESEINNENSEDGEHDEDCKNESKPSTSKQFFDEIFKEDSPPISKPLPKRKNEIDSDISIEKKKNKREDIDEENNIFTEITETIGNNENKTENDNFSDECSEDFNCNTQDILDRL